MSSGSTRIYIRASIALTMNPAMETIEDALITIENGRITNITKRPSSEILHGETVIDGSNCIVLPGLVNGHTHVSMGLFRGAAEDLPLNRWLKEVIFPLEKKWVNPEFISLGSKVSLVEMLRTGTTTFNNMDYFSDVVAAVTHDVGLRAIGGQTIIGEHTFGSLNKLRDNFDKYLERVSDYPLWTPALAPHSIYGVPREILREAYEYSMKRDLRVHIHLAEVQEEVDLCRKEFNRSPAAYLEECGFWSERTTIAHAVCIDEDDMEIFNKYKVGIAHNLESNMKLGTRICPVVELRKKGIPVAIGTDSVASNNNLDLLTEADMVAKLQNHRLGAGALKAEEVVKMLTIEGAKAIGMDQTIGSLEVGKAADIIAVDINNIHSVPLRSPYTHLVYGATGADVQHVVVNGKVLMQNRQLLTVDEEKILTEARQWYRGHM